MTVMLSPNATVHLQLWSRAEADFAADDDDAPFPSEADFAASAGSNQVTYSASLQSSYIKTNHQSARNSPQTMLP